MIISILQVLFILASFLPIKWLTWKITEEWGVPEWLEYKPWNCCLCLTFWTLLFFYLSVGVIGKMYIVLYGGIGLAILNAVAMRVHQRNNTIKLEDYND